MLSRLAALLVPFDRFCAHVVLSMLHGLWISPEALPTEVLGYLHQVVAASRVGRGPVAARAQAVQNADFVVSQLALWFEQVDGPRPGDFRIVDQCFANAFEQAIGPLERSVIQNARQALCNQELLVMQRVRQA